jgi:two-component system response regulator NreC
VTLLDLSMPEGGGMAALRVIRERRRDARVLVLTMHDDRAFLRAAIEAGAAGYITKSAADTELLTAIRAVHSGRTYIDVALANGEAASARKASGAEALAAGAHRHLSAREREVLEMVAKGHTNREIADRMGLSIKTVETYRARLLEKLGLETRAELVRYAMAAGLLRDAAG